jgi:hypothetical protein
LNSPDPATFKSATFKKLSVVMPASLHQRAKRYALETDQTLTELVITQLEQFLDGVKSDTPTG